MEAAAVKHERDCARWMGIQKTRRTRFVERYPNYCKTCDALGMIFVQEYYMGPVEETHCPDCAGLCPRCMTDTLVTRSVHRSYGDEEYDVCSVCGWRGDDDYGDKYCLPWAPECVCGAERRR